MKNSIPLKNKFQEASLLLKTWLGKLQKDLDNLSLSTTEAIQRFRRDHPELVQKWSETTERYKASIREMPKVLRKRPFVKKSLEELEVLEKEIRQFVAETKASSFRNLKEKPFFIKLQTQAHEASLLVAELELHPTVQKFLRGETVLSSRKNLQWRRKLTHVSLGVGFLILFFYSGIPRFWVWAVTLPFIIWAFSLETLRHLSPRVNKWVMIKFAPIMREAEEHEVNSAIFYMISLLFVYFVFPSEVTILSLLFIAVGDPIAGIVGTLWGRHRISSHVSWEGSLACFGACFLLSAFSAGILFDHSLHGFRLFFFSIFSGLVGAAAEASFKKLDDNLVMPLLSAPALWVLMKLFY